MGRPTIIIRLADAVLCSGIEPMYVPDGGPHVREAELRIPMLFHGQPAVTTTVWSTTLPGGVGTVFGTYSIRAVPIRDETLVRIQATNVQSGVAIPGDFVCAYHLVGRPLIDTTPGETHA